MSPCCPSQTLKTNTVTFNINFSLSVQITAARHATKTDCGVGITTINISCCDILVMVGDTACKSGKTLS